jgi:hypothetical protein
VRERKKTKADSSECKLLTITDLNWDALAYAAGLVCKRGGSQFHYKQEKAINSA